MHIMLERQGPSSMLGNLDFNIPLQSRASMFQSIYHSILSFGTCHFMKLYMMPRGATSIPLKRL